jgi:hypothetical protein
LPTEIELIKSARAVESFRILREKTRDGIRSISEIYLVCQSKVRSAVADLSLGNETEECFGHASRCIDTENLSCLQQALHRVMPRIAAGNGRNKLTVLHADKASVESKDVAFQVR